MRSRITFLAILAFWPLLIHAGGDTTRTATVYGTRFDGRKMANGKIYRHWGISCAANDWPLGTRVQVRQGKNVQECTVTDRMARRFTGRRIDLSGGLMRRFYPGYRGDSTPHKFTATVRVIGR